MKGVFFLCAWHVNICNALCWCFWHRWACLNCHYLKPEKPLFLPAISSTWQDPSLHSDHWLPVNFSSLFHCSVSTLWSCRSLPLPTSLKRWKRVPCSPQKHLSLLPCVLAASAQSLSPPTQAAATSFIWACQPFLCFSLCHQGLEQLPVVFSGPLVS